VKQTSLCWRNLWCFSLGNVPSPCFEDGAANYTAWYPRKYFMFETLALLGCYMVYIGNYLPMYQYNLSFPSSKWRCKNLISSPFNYVVLCSVLDIWVVKCKRPESRGRQNLEDSKQWSSEPSIQDDISLSQLSVTFNSVMSGIGGGNTKLKRSFLTSTRLHGSSDQLPSTSYCWND